MGWVIMAVLGFAVFSAVLLWLVCRPIAAPVHLSATAERLDRESSARAPVDLSAVRRQTQDVTRRAAHGAQALRESREQSARDERALREQARRYEEWRNNG